MDFLGKNIGWIIKVHNLSQQQMADIMDTKQPQIKDYVEGKTLPKVDKILNLSKYFKYSMEDLLQRDLEIAGPSEIKQLLVVDNADLPDWKRV